MITLTANADYGKSGQFVARITGRDTKYTFAREFVGRKTGKRGETTEADVDEVGLYECCDIGKRGKDSRFRLVVPNRAGDDVIWLASDKEDAMKIAKAMDEGREFLDTIEIIRADAEASATKKQIDELKYDDNYAERKAELTAQLATLEAAGRHPKTTYRIQSAKQAAKAQAGQTLDSATEACWAVLQALPPKEAGKVLAALKARLKPPVADSPATEAPSSEEPQS